MAREGCEGQHFCRPFTRLCLQNEPPPLTTQGRLAPVFEDEAVDAAEVFGVVGDDGPLMAQPGGGDEDIGDADGCSLVEQSGVDTGGDPGALGIEREDLKEGDEARDFGSFIVAMFQRCPIRTLEEFELGDDGNETVFGAACGEAINDFFAAAQDVDADVGVEEPLHKDFST